MYKHTRTEDGEYPRTVREVLHHAVTLLAEEHPERVVPREESFGVSAYSWDGAGSEKGGSAEHIAYEQVVFLPEREGTVSVVSAGKKKHDLSNMVLIMDDHTGELSEYRRSTNYSALLHMGIRPELASKLLEYYQTQVKGVVEPGYSFSIALDRLLEDGTTNFRDVPLFGFDAGRESFEEGVFALNRYGTVRNGRDLEKFMPEYWSYKLRGSIADRIGVSRFIADYMYGRVPKEKSPAEVLMRRPRELQDYQERGILRPLERAA